MLILIGACAFLTVSLLIVAIVRAAGARRARLAGRVAAIAASDQREPQARDGRALLRIHNYSSMPLVQRWLASTARAERIADDLDRAAIPLRVGEYISLRILIGLGAATLVGLALPGGPLRIVGMLAALALGYWLPSRVVARRITRRRAKIEAALPEALDMLTRSMRAGNGLLTAIDSMVEQIPGPVGEEFGRMRRELAASIGMADALDEMDRRVASRDVHIVVTAFQIQREVGGNLAEILENVAATMRERVTLRREMLALTSQQRFATWVVAAIPPIIFAAFTLTDRDYVAPMVTSAAGWVVIGIAGLLELTGLVALRRLVTSFEV